MPGEPTGIPGTARPIASCPLGHRVLDVRSRHVTFDDTAVDFGGVAEGELVADARLLV